MKHLPTGTITDVVAAYRGCDADTAVPEGADPASLRHLSWDVCRAHFADSKLKRKESKRELDRLHLVAYLAAQGMLQGASGLLYTNVFHYDAALEALRAHAEDVADLNPKKYRKAKHREKLLAAQRDVSLALLPNSGGIATAASKSLLAVFGCLPGFDGAFSTAMRDMSEDVFPASTFNAPTDEGLEFIAEFYLAHAEEIDGLAERIRVVDVAAGEYTDMPVGRARVIDMFTTQWAAQLAEERKAARRR
ncbi:hypothetical protein [Corynebacterium sp. 335C]